MSSFGSGLGSLIGGGLASADLSAAQNDVGNDVYNLGTQEAPYQGFGSSMLPQAQTTIGNNGTIGGGRFTSGGNNVPQFEDFMNNFSLSPGAQYTLGQETEAQNNSAASTGKLLSGTNERALTNIANGVTSTDASQQYQNVLAGNQQQFGQLQDVLGNFFQGIGVGQTATGQNASVVPAELGATANIAGSQAKADQAKGSGIGSMFSGLGSIAAMF